MSRIHVCSLALVRSHLASSAATHLMTLLGPAARLDGHPELGPDNYLRVGISDIVAGDDGAIQPEHERDGHVLPQELHVMKIIAFARRWAEGRGHGALLIHCYAGVSRSTAAALIAVLAIAPERDETVLARQLRRLSPTASPNRLMIRLADRLLQREGRLVAAVAAIGRGEECYEGVPFSLDV